LFSAERVRRRGKAEQELAAENARLKRKLAEKEQEVAMLEKWSAYFAKNLE
jgi:transposase